MTLRPTPERLRELAIRWQVNAARAHQFTLTGSTFDRAAWQRTAKWMAEHSREATHRWMEASR
jgi:hypothetical protein